MMKKTLGAFTLFTAVSLFAVAGCKSKAEDEAKDSSAMTDDTPTDPADPANPCGDKPADPSGDTAADATGDTPSADDEAAAAIPTEEDFEETATAEITSDNLESELAKLEKELE